MIYNNGLSSWILLLTYFWMNLLLAFAAAEMIIVDGVQLI